MSLWTRGVAAFSLVALLAVVAGGCSSDLPAIAEDDAAACAALIAALPDEVAGQDRSEDSDRTTSWGDIELTCGVGVPAAYDEFADCSVVGDVGWFLPPAELRDPTADIVVTALTYSPRVSVLVPATQRGTDAVQAQIAPAIRETLTPGEPCL